MIERDGNRLIVTTAMTMETVGPLLDCGASQIGKGEVEFDLSAVKDTDSAALSLMFEWLRVAQASNGTIIFSNLPQSLISLATLYGVMDMIPQRVAASH